MSRLAPSPSFTQSPKVDVRSPLMQAVISTFSSFFFGVRRTRSGLSQASIDGSETCARLFDFVLEYFPLRSTAARDSGESSRELGGVCDTR
jgi:hypothetical protein